MLFKCKDTSFFSNMEGFLIFFCNFACKFKGICPNGERKSPISGRKFPIGRVFTLKIHRVFTLKISSRI